MRWENLTGLGFETGVAQAQGVCIIPIGVLEYHGPHLPLGTDMLYSYAVACAAGGLVGQEARLFRFTLGHSLFFVAIIGVITTLQAYVFPWMIP